MSKLGVLWAIQSSQKSFVLQEEKKTLSERTTEYDATGHSQRRAFSNRRRKIETCGKYQSHDGVIIWELTLKPETPVTSFVGPPTDREDISWKAEHGVLMAINF